MIEWKDVKGYEGLYEVSNTGQVKKKEKIMKTRILRNYETVGLTKNGIQKTKQIHRLVADAFLINPLKKQEVNHIDGNKLNNISSNLEWVTKSENALHAFSIGLREMTCGGTSKKIAKICSETGIILETYPSLRYLERNTNYNRKFVSQACRNNELYKKHYWKFI